jgi:hypothetical protein
MGIAQSIRHSPGFGIASQIVRGKPLQTNSLGTFADSVPDNILRDAFAPDLAFFADCAKDPALFDPSSSKPSIDRIFYPQWHWYRANMRAFTH